MVESSLGSRTGPVALRVLLFPGGFRIEGRWRHGSRKEGGMKRREKNLGAVALAVFLSVTVCMPVSGRGTCSEASETDLPVAGGYTLTVKNNCDFDLYLRGADLSSRLVPDNQLLSAHGGSHQYQVPIPWTSGRIYGCWDDTSKMDIIGGKNAYTMKQHCGFVEMTLKAGGVLSSNITFVDAISLPMRIEAPGGSACTNGGSVTAAFNPADIVSKCPTKVLNNRACISAYYYCADFCRPGDRTCAAYCSKFDPVIKDCKAHYPGCNAGNAVTKDVYGCTPTSFFSSAAGEKYCAAINRGILESYDKQTNPKTFYPQGKPYNDYSALVHKTVGPIFGFPYDDYPSRLNQGGYLNCQASSQYILTFCPNRGKLIYSYLGDALSWTAWDGDVFRFSGTAEEEVVLRLEAVGDDARGRADLVVRGRDFQEKDRGELPLAVRLTLPHTGTYQVAVHNAAGGAKAYVGHYRLSIECSRNAWETLKPAHGVE